MNAVFRCFVACLIALALPVQGMASMTMAHCGQGHERKHSDQEPAHHHERHDSANPHHHESALTEASDEAPSALTEASDEVAAANHPPAQADELSDLARCSSCASCCAGSVLPSVMLRIPEPAPAPTVFVVDIVDIGAFATGGPDRPPRSILA